MMKLIKLENNKFIYLDNFWLNNQLMCKHDKFLKILFIIFILLLNCLNSYGQLVENENKLIPKTTSTAGTTTIIITTTTIPTTTTTTTTSTNTAPRNLKFNSLTDEYAIMYSNWLDSVSIYLYDLTLTFSGFKSINRTYNTRLIPEHKAVFASINFTTMIVNISNTISEFLNNKTVIVKELSEIAEEAYDDYENGFNNKNENETNYEENTSETYEYQYYNAKTSLAFCDDPRFEEAKQRLTAAITVDTITSLNSTNLTNYTNMTENTSKMKRNIVENLYVEEGKSKNSSNHSSIKYKHAPHRHHNFNKHTRHHIKSHEITQNTVSNLSNFTEVALEVFSQPLNFPTVHHYYGEKLEYSLFEQLTDDTELTILTNLSLNRDPVTRLKCLTNDNDEFFPQQLKINRTNSTVHIPTNVFNRETKILRTAEWTEKLDEAFKRNFENDKELFWQYFCSAYGLFRRYPGAIWTTPKNQDFFDCRLQSWYISAAASPKDVVILLDVSGSMTGLRLEIAKKLIESIMDTFTDNDFFNILTFSSSAQYLMNLENETEYSGRLIQAGYYNKLKFIEKLKYYRNTTNMAMFKTALNMSFNLIHNITANDRGTCGCNKIIMIITDGTTENTEETMKSLNWNQNDPARIFTFMIGRDMTDPRSVKWMACANRGEYYHVATLADVNEHVHEYIPVLSRPMALLRKHETTWSNVFIGHIDKELKIAVARPAFKYFDNSTTNKNSERNNWSKREELLLGVVGVDVPVLKLISKVSPKFQMGVGIYIIMLDNNGYIVFHPSIREEMKKSEFDHKGRSHSVDLNSFEVPIGNELDFEQLEQNMINQNTTNYTTLKNYKREGLRVVKRETEYVYTPVNSTPFSVAIASPKSFGQFYVDLPPSEESNYNEKLKKLLEHLRSTSSSIKTRVQMYNCSYEYIELIQKVLEDHHDYCLDYARQDHGQILAIKVDLLLNEEIYDSFNYTLYAIYKNLIRSFFYGTYSGMTFYLPITSYRSVTKIIEDTNTNFTFGMVDLNSSLNAKNIVHLKSKNQPTTTTTRKPSITVEESYNQSVNMFTIEENKHTFSFEKQYYTRSIEFSDYMRTEYNDTEPLAIYFLNESSRDYKNETVGATLSIWLDKVPTAVSGVVYDAMKFKDVIFENKISCPNGACQNLCSKNRLLNVTCYLVDEHGVVILSTSERATRKDATVGSPLYKVNPWLMRSLHKSGIYNLIIPGPELKECRPPQLKANSATILKSLTSFVITVVSFLFNKISTILIKIGILFSITFNNKDFINENIFPHQSVMVEATRVVAMTRNELNENILNQNNNCYFFGVYSLNITKAKSLNASDFRVWCDNMRYLVGYVKYSNLIMIVAENEPDLAKCGNIFEDTEVKARNKIDKKTETNSTQSDYNVNRYRKKPLHCHKKYPDEDKLLPCSLVTNIFIKKMLIIKLVFLNVLFSCYQSFNSLVN